MKKRFIVMLDSHTEEANNQFLKWIREEGLGWWHWLGSSWLLSDSRGKFSATEVRDKARETFKGHCLVVEISGNDDRWSGYGPNSDANNMFTWLKDNWKGETP